EHERSALPAGRAAVLKRVIDDVIRRWETGERLQEREPRLGGLDGTDAVLAARDAFRQVGHVVYLDADPIYEEVLGRLGVQLAARFGLSEGAALAAAVDALRIWDEAGVFIIDGPSRRVRARVRTFADVAEAENVAALADDEQRAWLRSNWGDPSQKHAVLLAAGLSKVVCDELLALTAADLDSAAGVELVRDAMQQGAVATEPVVAAFAERLLDVDETPLDPWDRAQTLIELPLPSQQQPACMRFIDTLDSPARIVARALTTETWSRTDEEADNDLEAVVGLEPPVRLARKEESYMRLMHPDPHYQRAVLLVAQRHLSEDRPEIADRLIERVHRGVSMAIGMRITQRLADSGFEAKLAADRARRERERPQLAAAIADLRESKDADLQLLEILAGLGSPAQLGRVQRRRLDDVVSLVRTSGFGRAPAYEAEAAVSNSGEELVQVLRVAAQLAGLDVGIVAAQADELRRELQRDPDKFAPWCMLFDGGSRFALQAWDRVDDAPTAATTLADAVAGPYEWIGMLAVECLQSAPAETKASASARLQRHLPLASARIQRLVAIAILMLDANRGLQERFAIDPCPPVRRASAWAQRMRSSSAQQAAALRQLLADDDAGVREEAAESVASLERVDSLRDELERAARERVGWQCLNCATDNRPGNAVCTRCRINGPNLTETVGKILAHPHRSEAASTTMADPA
ncbi:MAG: hypothetical protein ACYC0H_17660, partial [Solirubrobacteraceae bacterium]